MTDAPAPRVRRGSARANPPPRSALPRVTPLAAGDQQPGTVVDEASGPLAPAQAQPPATGRDLLIPQGSEQTRRKSRGSATVPTLAELMPPPEQRGGKKQHAPAPPTTGLAHLDRVDRSHGKGKHGKGKAAEQEPVKEVALEVTLSKGLRKRLKGKAAELGLSSEAAVAQLVEVWVDG